MIFMLIVVICGSGINVYAAEERGSVKIMLSDGEKGTKKEGVVFAYARVAEIVDGEYCALGQYDGIVDFQKLRTAKESEAAAEKLKNHVEQPDGSAETNQSGVAEIRDLETGVYLIYVKDQADYEVILPFLTAVPTWNESRKIMDMEVIVEPKHEAVTEQPPTAPQTNLDSGYAQLFAMAAAGILSGLILLVGNNRRRTGN